MGRLAVVAVLPEDPDDPTRVDFVSREFDTWDEITQACAAMEAAYPKWQVVSFCHVEDLPLLVDPWSEGATGDAS